VDDNLAARRMAEKSQLQGESQMETRITMKVFKAMLELSPLSDLLAESTRHGKPDCSPWTYVFEEHSIHPLATEYIWSMRREWRNEVMRQDFRRETDRRLKAQMLQVPDTLSLIHRLLSTTDLVPMCMPC